MMRSKSIQKKFLNYIKYPFRVLARARDLYLKSLTGGSHVSYGNAMGCPTPHIPSLPRSFGTTSDLIRVFPLAGNTDVELRRTRSSMVHGSSGVAVAVRRSKTVAYGRIEEEMEYEVGEEERIGLLGKLVHPISRSCAGGPVFR